MAVDPVVDAMRTRKQVPRAIDFPAPSTWPVVVAFGVTLLFAGLVTSAVVSLLGLLSAAIGIAGWFRDVFPHEALVSVRVVDEEPPVVTKRREVARVDVAPESQRAWLPLEIYPLSAGDKSGFAENIAMEAAQML